MPEKRRKPASKAVTPPDPVEHANGHLPGDEHPAEAAGTPEAGQKKFDIFIIDTGWNAPISKALAQNIDHIRTYLGDDDVYVLDRDQSRALIKQEPATIGHDPMIFFLNRARKEAGHERYGIRLNLGLIRHPEQAMAKLQSALRLIAEHRDEPSLVKVVRADLRKAGLDGALHTLSEAALELA